MSLIIITATSCLSEVNVDLVGKKPIANKNFGENVKIGFSESTGFDILTGSDIGFFVSSTYLTVKDLADPSVPITVSSFQFTGGKKIKVLSGDRAYVLGDDFISLLNISDLEDIRMISSVGLGTGVTAEEFEVNGDYAYASLGASGFAVVSFEDKDNPLLIHREATVGSSVGIHHEGTTLFTSDDTVLVVYDISDHNSITELGRFDTTDTGILDIKKYQNHIFLLMDGNLETLDGTDYASMSSLGIKAVAGSYYKFANFENNIFVLSGVSDLDMEIIDLTVPGAPVTIDSKEFSISFLGNYGFDIQIKNNKIYLQDPATTLYIFDLFPLTSVNELDRSFNNLGGRGVTDLKMIGNIGYSISSSGSLSEIDFTDPRKPKVLNTGLAHFLAEDIIISNGHVIVKDWGFNPSIQSFALNDLSTPVSTITFNIGIETGVGEISRKGNTMYMGNSGNGVQVIDTTDPTNLVASSTLPTSGDVYETFVVGDTLYVIDSIDFLKIYDISTSLTPILNGNIGAKYYDIIGVFTDSLYLRSNGDIEIFDITDPLNPIFDKTIVGVLGSGISTSVYDQNNTLYISNPTTETLLAYDVSSPSSPVLIGSLNIGFSRVGNLSLVGNTLYIGNYDGRGLLLLDITDRANPTFL